MDQDLKNVPKFDSIEDNIECRVYVVGHIGNDRNYCTFAESRKIAALAYVAMVGAQGNPVPIKDVWVRGETRVQSFPLLRESDTSVRNWLDEDPSRATRLQAAVKQLKAVVNE